MCSDSDILIKRVHYKCVLYVMKHSIWVNNKTRYREGFRLTKG